jgi:hypothetical protein
MDIRTDEIVSVVIRPILKDCSDECAIRLPKIDYQNITAGANFTHVFFSSKEELDKFKKQNQDLFSVVGASGTLMPYGLYHLVY